MLLKIVLMCSFFSSSNLEYYNLASEFLQNFFEESKDYKDEGGNLIEVIKKLPSDNRYQFEDFSVEEDYSYVEEELDYEELFEEYKKQFMELGDKVGKEVKKVGDKVEKEIDKVEKEIKEVGYKVRKYEEKLFKSALDSLTGKLYKKIDEKKWLFDTLFHLWLGILDAKKKLLYKLWLKKKGKKKGRSNEHYEFVIPYYVYSTTYKPHLYHEHEEPKVHLIPKHVSRTDTKPSQIPNPHIRGKYEFKQGNHYDVIHKAEDDFQPSYNDQSVDEVYKDTSQSILENVFQESYIDNNWTSVAELYAHIHLANDIDWLYDAILESSLFSFEDYFKVLIF